MRDSGNARVHIPQFDELSRHRRHGQNEKANKQEDQATHAPQIGLPLKSGNRPPHIPTMSDTNKWH
ncbi:MAG: hypothetical protein CFE26_19560, partial [Verrucomicrobiales bacterium VVV1]